MKFTVVRRALYRTAYIRLCGVLSTEQRISDCEACSLQNSVYPIVRRTLYRTAYIRLCGVLSTEQRISDCVACSLQNSVYPIQKTLQVK